MGMLVPRLEVPSAVLLHAPELFIVVGAYELSVIFSVLQVASELEYQPISSPRPT